MAYKFEYDISSVSSSPPAREINAVRVDLNRNC